MSIAIIDLDDTDFSSFCKRVAEAVTNHLEVTGEYQLQVGFPSAAFPIAPERADSSATLSSINHEFIMLANTLRKAGQTKLLRQGQNLTHLTKLAISPYDIQDAGNLYRFRVVTKG